MRAETWMKTLNARLLAEPNWAVKAGYLTVLIAASLALAAFLILRITFSFLGNMAMQTGKNFTCDRDADEFVTATSANDDSDDEGPRWGSQENGYRTDGHYYVDGTRMD